MKIDEAVATFIRLRDMKDEMKKRHKDELQTINDGLEKLEAWLQRELLKSGVDSYKTAAGTAFLQRATSATVKDWTATLDYIKSHNDWSLLDARVSKTAVKDFIESTGEVPPGVDYKVTTVTRVRR